MHFCPNLECDPCVYKKVKKFPSESDPCAYWQWITVPSVFYMNF